MIHFAYLDPGTGTLIVQALLGGAAGVAVLLKTRGRRLFRKNEAGEAPQDAGRSEAEEPTVPSPSAD